MEKQSPKPVLTSRVAYNAAKKKENNEETREMK